MIFSDFSKFFQLLEIIENNNNYYYKKNEEENFVQKKNLEGLLPIMYCEIVLQ